MTVCLCLCLQLFSRYQEQVGELEALRQKEAAERKTLQAALDSQQADWQEQLQQEQAKRLVYCYCTTSPGTASAPMLR